MPNEKSPKTSELESRLEELLNRQGMPSRQEMTNNFVRECDKEGIHIHKLSDDDVLELYTHYAEWVGKDLASAVKGVIGLHEAGKISSKALLDSAGLSKKEEEEEEDVVEKDEEKSEPSPLGGRLLDV